MPLRLCTAILLLLGVAQAEEFGAAGVLRGQLSAAPQGNSGHLRVRENSGTVYVCSFDSGTYVERYGEHVAASGLLPGDPVEIIADRKASTPCYALTVRVTEQRPVTVPTTGFRSRPRTLPRRVFDTWLPRGNLTYAGVVLRANPEVLIIRTRDGEERSIVLRDDTRYMDSGNPSERAALRPNTRVFVRAGRNIDQEVEAYQVVWGRIEGP